MPFTAPHGHPHSMCPQHPVLSCPQRGPVEILGVFGECSLQVRELGTTVTLPTVPFKFSLVSGTANALTDC